MLACFPPVLVPVFVQTPVLLLAASTAAACSPGAKGVDAWVPAAKEVDAWEPDGTVAKPAQEVGQDDRALQQAHGDGGRRGRGEQRESQHRCTKDGEQTFLRWVVSDSIIGPRYTLLQRPHWANLWTRAQPQVASREGGQRVHPIQAEGMVGTLWKRMQNAS